jgi:hypothetical protein
MIKPFYGKMIFSYMLACVYIFVDLVFALQLIHKVWNNYDRWLKGRKEMEEEIKKVPELLITELAR